MNKPVAVDFKRKSSSLKASPYAAPDVATPFSLTAIQRTQNAHPFILVLIDADADDYIVSCQACSIHSSCTN